MSKQQTAVEWLEEICNNRGYYLMSEYFSQAKEMENQQITELKQQISDLENQIIEMGEHEL